MFFKTILKKQKSLKPKIKNKMKIIKKIIFSLFIFSVFSCVSTVKKQNVVEVVDSISEPKFNVKSFFDGGIEGFGITQNENGQIIATQKINISAKWTDKRGVIEKSYSSSDGDKDNVTWLVDLKDSGVFSVLGHGFTSSSEGKQIGNAMQITYKNSIPKQDGSKEESEVVENYYLVDEDSLILISNKKTAQGVKTKSIVSLKKVQDSSSRKDSKDK